MKIFSKSEKKTTVTFYSVIKIAASFLILVTVGIGIYTSYQQEKFLNAVFSETFSEPADAVKQTGEIMAKVSSLHQLVPETIVIQEDSIETKETDTIKVSIDYPK